MGYPPINPRLPTIWHGGDYNPEQWPPSTWDEDIRHMQASHFRVATVGVFSWVSLQPAEDHFTFDWLDDVLERLHAGDRRVCLATPTMAQPAWMSRSYADVLRADGDGVRRHHGRRQNYCPTSPNYRRLAQGIAARLAERYAGHPALVAWHVSNEYGGACYCQTCAAEFRRWLQQRYVNLDELNQRWWTAFWSHTYTDWEEIEPPYTNGESLTAGLTIDYKRFLSEAMLACFTLERHRLPARSQSRAQGRPAVHADGTDAEQPELASGECPQAAWRPAPVELSGRRPWRRYGDVLPVAPRPGWVGEVPRRRARARPRHEHKGVPRGVGAGGRAREARQRNPGRDDAGAGGGAVRLEQLVGNRQCRRANPGEGVRGDGAQALSGVLSVQRQRRRGVQRLRSEQVRGRGCTDAAHGQTRYGRTDSGTARGRWDVRDDAFSGVVDETDLAFEGYPGPLRPLLGIWIEEIDALYDGQTNHIVSSRRSYECSRLCEIVRPEGAEVLATFGDEFYAGSPAVTRQRVGSGQAYYIATDPEDAFLDAFYGGVLEEHGIRAPLKTPPGVEVAERIGSEGRRLLFLLNHTGAPARIRVSGSFRNLLTDQPVSDVFDLKVADVAVLVQG